MVWDATHRRLTLTDQDARSCSIDGITWRPLDTVRVLVTSDGTDSRLGVWDPVNGARFAEGAGLGMGEALAAAAVPEGAIGLFLNLKHTTAALAGPAVLQVLCHSGLLDGEANLPALPALAVL